MLTHVSLFSGIGGNELAAQWAGFQTVLMCEIDPFCRAVLNKHFPGIPIIEDVHDVTYANFSRLQAAGAELQAAGITGSDVLILGNAFRCGLPRESRGRAGEKPSDGYLQSETQSVTNSASADGRGENRNALHKGRPTGKNRGTGISEAAERGTGFTITDDKSANPDGRTKRITLLTAGVPCQPASTAGKRRGKADDRWLWPEAIRVLGELQPAWAVFENPAGIISLDEFSGLSDLEDSPANPIPDEYAGGLDEIIGQIEERGYEVQTVLIPACAVNAFHRRDRVFIIAHANNTGSGTPRNGDDGNRQKEIQNGGFFSWVGTGGYSETATNANTEGLQGGEKAGDAGECGAEPQQFSGGFTNLPDWAGGEMGQPSPLTEFERPDGEDDAHTNGIVWSAGGHDKPGIKPRHGKGIQGQAGNDREIECEFRILPDGVSERLVRPVRNRVSQLKAYGNAVVPESVYPIFKAIADLESL